MLIRRWLFLAKVPAAAAEVYTTAEIIAAYAHALFAICAALITIVLIFIIGRHVLRIKQGGVIRDWLTQVDIGHKLVKVAVQ